MTTQKMRSQPLHFWVSSFFIPSNIQPCSCSTVQHYISQSVMCQRFPTPIHRVGLLTHMTEKKTFSVRTDARDQITCFQRSEIEPQQSHCTQRAYLRPRPSGSLAVYLKKCLAELRLPVNGPVQCFGDNTSIRRPSSLEVTAD